MSRSTTSSRGQLSDGDSRGTCPKSAFDLESRSTTSSRGQLSEGDSRRTCPKCAFRGLHLGSRDSRGSCPKCAFLSRLSRTQRQAASLSLGWAPRVHMVDDDDLDLLSALLPLAQSSKRNRAGPSSSGSAGEGGCRCSPLVVCQSLPSWLKPPRTKGRRGWASFCLGCCVATVIVHTCSCTAAAAAEPAKREGCCGRHGPSDHPVLPASEPRPSVPFTCKKCRGRIAGWTHRVVNMASGSGQKWCGSVAANDA